MRGFDAITIHIEWKKVCIHSEVNSKTCQQYHSGTTSCAKKV